MNRIVAALEGIVKQRSDAQKTGAPLRCGLMTHVVLGFPSLEESLDIVKAMADSGASLIELQLPFSDPMADGPTIMNANEEALLQGVCPRDCMKAIEKLRSQVSVPLLIMSYFNLLYSYRRKGAKRGFAVFLQDASAAGVDGLIVPDIPPEESAEEYWTLPQQFGLLPIPLVSPLSSKKRLQLIADTVTEGFVYCVAATGTTGVRNKLPEDLSQYLTRVRKYFSLPLAVGFGISQLEQVQSLALQAEIAIVGSAMIELVKKTPKGKRLTAVRRFTRELSSLCPVGKS